jgi:phosphoglycolate phosphatase
MAMPRWPGRLLVAGGMDPDTGHILPDSLLAAGNTVEIATGMVAAGAPYTVEALTVKLDGLFSNSAEYAVPVTDLAGSLPACMPRATASASPPAITSARSAKPPSALASTVTSIMSRVMTAASAPSRSPAWCMGFCAATGLEPHQVAVVGDNNHDLHMGRNAGVGLTVAVLTGTGSPQSLAAASDHCLNDITELETVLI